MFMVDIAFPSLVFPSVMVLRPCLNWADANYGDTEEDSML